MATFNPIVELTVSKIRTMIREPEAVFWVFVFPVLLALALGIAFRATEPEPVSVAVQRGPDAAWMMEVLEDRPDVRPELLDAEIAERELRTGRVELVVLADGDTWTFWQDPTRPRSREARLLIDSVLQCAAGRVDARETASRDLSERGSRYIDFLIPGLLGMNLMGTGMWGIGFNVVFSRQRRQLKRMVATPMRRSHYLLSHILSRFVFLGLEVGVLLAFAVLVFGVPVRGSFVTLAMVCVLGALTFAGLGLLVASRARTVEGVSGLMNLVMLPMWMASGIFFSTSRFPDAVQPLIQALPLTAVNDGLRAVMLEGATVGDIGGELAITVAWAVLSFLLALRLFRWQ